MSKSACRSFVFSGGGTGGHLFPGIAVAQELLARDEHTRVLFVGTNRSVERQIVTSHGYDHRVLGVEPSTLLHKNPLRFARRSWQAFRDAKRMLGRDKPDAVIGLGGFASVPVVIAATSLAVPAVLLEQNVLPGRATRWLSGRAAVVCVSFPQAIEHLKRSARTTVTGNPVRREIAALGGRLRMPGDADPTLLVIGGSQGAAAVNEAMLRAAEKRRAELADWTIVHQTGHEQAGLVAQRYRELGLKCIVSAFFAELAPYYQRASLVISRAGATSLAELACAGCPAILIPYPNSLGDHQLLNARLFEAAGAGVIVEQHEQAEATSIPLAAHLLRLVNDPSASIRMARAMQSLAMPDAAARAADAILAVAMSSAGSRADAAALRTG